MGKAREAMLRILAGTGKKGQKKNEQVPGTGSEPKGLHGKSVPENISLRE